MEFTIYLVVTMYSTMYGYGSVSTSTSTGYYETREDCNKAVTAMAAEFESQRKHGIKVSGYCLPKSNDGR